MSNRKEFLLALEKAGALLEGWRKTRVNGEPYPEEVMRALCKAARLGSSAEVIETFGLGWRRLKEAMNNPRYQDEAQTCKSEKVKTSLEGTERKIGVETENLVTFTQLIPMENIQQGREVPIRQTAVMEIDLPTGAQIRVFDVSAAPVLQMLKETLLASGGRQ